MSKGAATLIAVLAVIGTIVGIPIASYITANNAGNRSEQQVRAFWEDNENLLAQYMQRVKEAAQVPAMQRDDLIAVFTGANESRYGKTGSAAVMQWIQEQNPNLDQATYVQIQRIIEAGREQFAKGQTRLVDAKRSYRTALGNFWGGFWLRTAGYPTIKVGYPIGAKDDYPIVSVAAASDAFRTGRETGPLQLR